MLGFPRARFPANDVGAAARPREARDDLELLARAARAGDGAALRTLLSSVGPAMLRVIRKILGLSTIDEDDVLQDAMLGFTTSLGAFREECTVMHFGCRVAVMTALAARRRARHQPEIDPALSSRELQLVPADLPDPATEAERAARLTVLWRLLDELPETQSAALVLHFTEGFTTEEIAAAESCPIETVKSRLRLAKAALRSRMAQDLQARDFFGGER